MELWVLLVVVGVSVGVFAAGWLYYHGCCPKRAQASKRKPTAKRGSNDEEDVESAGDYSRTRATSGKASLLYSFDLR